MKRHTSSQCAPKRDTPKNMLAVIGLAVCLSLQSLPACAQSTGQPSAAELEAMQNYQTAKADGRNADAVKYLLDYMEQAQGVNAPMTISLLQRYGNLLREEGESREAVAVLKEVRERAIATFGEDSLELFEINMDLGNAYAERASSFRRARQYYDAALEVLRKNDQHETVLYVTTLVAVASGLTEAGALEGAYSADTNGDGVLDLVNNGLSSVMRRFESGYGVLEEYLQDAIELAEALELEDPYLTEKIAIVQSRIKVRETMFLEAVSPSVRGSISTASAENRYLLEDSNLASVIDVLMQDVEKNQEYLRIANGARMEIAWLSEDMERMTDFCSDSLLDMASAYPPERLYEIDDDGRVIAPRFSFRISSNIFEQTSQKIRDARFSIRTSRSVNRARQRPEAGPYFVPVCIDGRLVAALINAPVVEVQDLE